MLVLYSILIGCAGRTVPTPDPDPIERFRVHIEADFTTQVPDALVGQPEAALLEPVGMDLDLVLTRERSRTFRDGSLGYVVTFAEVEATIRRGGATAPADLSLAGRAVELRTFEDGELLDVDLLQHAAGHGRYGDIFDLVFPILTPAPPDITGRGAVPRAMHWPVRLSDTEQLLNTLWASWRLMESSPAEWHLGYSGRWAIRGAQLAAGRKVPAGGEGEGEGEIWLSRQDGSLQKHTFSWQRELTLIYAPHEDEVLRVRQQQAFTGRLERM